MGTKELMLVQPILVRLSPSDWLSESLWNFSLSKIFAKSEKGVFLWWFSIWLLVLKHALCAVRIGYLALFVLICLQDSHTLQNLDGTGLSIFLVFLCALGFYFWAIPLWSIPCPAL